MAISARNRLSGTVKSIVLGTVMAEIVVAVAGGEMVAAITRHSVEALGLKSGDEVQVVVKATEVMIEK